MESSERRLAVAAEDEELAGAARSLEGTGASVEAVRVDLATDEGVDELVRHISAGGRRVHAVALNAGGGAGGAFTDTDLRDELRLVDLNVRSTVHLAKHLARDMAGRSEGRILALRDELEDTGVTVTLLMPGPTDTEFFERADMLDTKVGSGEKDDPADVARDGFEALMEGKERVVSASLSTKAQGRGSRVMPDGVKAEMHRRMAEPGSSKGS